MQNFSIGDQEKFDLLAFKNSKYLFYRFNDFVKVYGNPRYKLLHTRKMLDSVAMKKVEDKNKQFLIEKIIHGVEFENFYQANPENEAEIVKTVESSYKVARRVYQNLYFDIAELFYEYIQSIDSYKQQDMRKTFNELLVVPDGDTQPGENKINMKQLCDLFKNTNSHGLVSLSFLGLLFHFFESEKDLELVKNATTEIYKNLSYMTLSGGRELEFHAVSDFIGQLSFVIKGKTVQNLKQRQIENDSRAKKINYGRIFTPKINNPLDDVIEIIDDPNAEHKKTKFPYNEPTVQLPDEIKDSQKRIDHDYTDLLSKVSRVNNVVTEQKKQKEIKDMTETTIKDPIPTNDYWWEEDIFSTTDKHPTIDASKIIVDDIKQTTNDVLKNIGIQALSDNILRNLRPIDNRTIQELIDVDFIPIDDRTQEEREDDDNISLQSEDDNITLLSDNNDTVTIEDVLEPSTINTQPPTINIQPSNKPFTVTIEDVLKPPSENQIPPLAPPKTLDVDINALSDNILKNLRPIDNRNLQNLIDDDFIPIDDKTQQEREDNGNIG